jgi:hypothetical protein
MLSADTILQLSQFFRTRIPVFTSLCAVVFMCVALTSCVGHYCIMGVFNPGSTITGNNGECVNNKAMGNVSVRVTTAAASADGPMVPNLLHLFVTVQGIEAHPNAMAPEDSPDWEELAPDLVREPMQIDLLAHPANSCATNRSPSALVAAGTYRQIRLRLVPNHPATGDAVPAVNACGALGPHCAVSPDGHVHPLAFDSGATILRVAPDRIPGGFFHVLPDTETHLNIEFNALASFAASSGDTVQVTPVFSVDSAAPCSTPEPSEP